MRASAQLSRFLSVVLASTHLLWSTSLLAAMSPGAPGESVAIVSNVSGEAFVRPAEDPGRARAAAFKGPVVYGDRITTSKDSTLGLLLGQRDLLTVLENSNVEIKEPKPGFKVIEMSSGKVCMATPKLVSKGEQPTTVRTPNSTATAQPGTLFQVEVSPTPGVTMNHPPESSGPQEGRIYRTSMLAQAGSSGPVVIETFTVIEGSVDIVSQVTASAPVRVTSGRAVKVVNGVIGEPYEAPPVTCRLQDAQVTPVHTTIPPGARDVIDNREIEQAERLVAYVHKPPTPPAPQDLQRSVPGGLVLPTTRLYAFGDPPIPPPVFPPPPAPVLVFQGGNIQQSIPFISVIDPPNTQKGPDTLFQLNNFNGNNSNIPLGVVGLNIFNLGEYLNPQNPNILQGSIQVRTTSGVDVPIVHGVSFTNSNISPAPGYPGPVVQIEDSRVTAFTPTVPGILVRLTNSQLTSNDFLLHQNSNPLNQTTLNGTLLQAEQGSQVTVNGTFANVDPSTIIVNGSLLTLTGGSTLTTTGPLIDLSGSVLTGNLAPLVNVNGGTLNLGSAGNPAGLARLLNSTINANAGLLSVSAGAVNSTGTFIAMQGVSVLNGTGNLISIGSGGTLNLGSGSLLGGPGIVNVTGDVVNVSGTGAVTNSAGAAPVFAIGGGPVVTTGGSLFNMTGTGTTTLASPLLELAGGVTSGSATPFLQMGGGILTDTAPLINAPVTTTILRPLMLISGGTVTAPTGLSVTAPFAAVSGLPLFTVSGGSLAIAGNLVSLNTDLTVSGSLLTVTGGNTTIGGNILNVTGPRPASFTTNMINVSSPGTLTVGSLINASGGSSVTINGLAISAPSGTVTGTGTFVVLDNSSLLIAAGGKVITTGNNLNIVNGGLLSATGGTITLFSTGLASVGGGAIAPSALVSVQGGNILSAGSTLIGLSGTTLTIPSASPLVVVQDAGSQLTVNNGDLLALRNGSTLTGLGATQSLLNTTGGATANVSGNLVTLETQNFPARNAPLFTANAATDSNIGVTIGGSVASLTGSNLTIIGAGLLTLLNGLPGPPLPFSMGSFATLQGGSNFTIESHVAEITGFTVTLTGSGPAVTVNGSSASIAGDLVSLANNSSLNAPRGLLALSGGSTVTIANAIIEAPAGNTLTATDTLVTSTGSTLEVNSSTAAAISINNVGIAGSSANLQIAGGGLLNATGGTLTFASQLASLTGGTGAAGAAGGNASLTTGITPVSLNGTNVNGATIFVTAGDGGNGVGNGGAGGTASVTVANGGMFSQAGGTATTTNIVNITAGSGGTAPGTALGGNGGTATLSATQTLMQLSNNAVLTSTDHAIALSGGSGGDLTAGSGTGGAAGAGGSVTALIVNGGLLGAVGGTVTVNNLLASVVGGSGGFGGLAGPGGAGGNATLTAGGTLITLNGTTFSLNGMTVLGGSGGGGTTPGANGTGNMTVNGGGVLTVTGGRVESFGNFVTVNGNLTATGVLVSLSNMSAAPPAHFHDDLINISDSVLCNTPGSCSRAPGVLQATDVGSAADPMIVGGAVLRLDQALFEATAPLINLVRSHLITSDALNMANNASYISSNPANAFANLDASTLNATSALVTMSGGTFTHAGNLISLANGSTLIANTLAFLSGGSFSVGGALVALSGVGNTLTINANCGGGCLNFGLNNSVPILFQNGATLGNTTVNIPAAYNAYSGPTAGNTLPGLTKPLLIVDGPATKSIKLGP